MSTASEPTGTLEAALARTDSLLKVDPKLAAEQALEILKAVPEYAPAQLLLAAARRLSGDPAAGLELIDPLLSEQPKWIAAHFEHGLALAAVGRGNDAIKALQRTVELKPEHTQAWRVLGDHLMAIGDNEAADAAYARHIHCSTKEPVLQQAAAAMIKNDVPTAERLLKAHLSKVPTDVPAIRMLAEVAMRLGREEDAENLLLRCLELAPSFAAARYNYAILLHRRNDSAAAIVELEQLLAAEPQNPSYRNLHAVTLSRIGEYERSSRIYSELLSEYAGNAKIWLSYGHVLKTEGRQAECIDVYRKSIECDPAFGEAYWSLANLKTFRFSESDLTEMHAQLADPQLGDENRLHLHFALGKAYEDGRDYAKSFEHYHQGNALHRSGHPYDANRNTARAERLKKLFSRQLFEQRAGSGCTAPDPIFIVGMPRSGSTLLEQMLSCHTQIEGTSELPEVASLAKELRAEADTEEIAVHAEVLSTKSADELRELGEQYLERARIHRKTDRPFFIDKMPNNFLHIGMIQLLLPNAKIIDARRHPMACCFSNFKQYFARGQNFSYGLEDMGRFYRDYVELMAHFDDVLPGRVHRVFYEQTVADTETVVREMLDYCGLDFEPDCLRFFDSQRASTVREPGSGCTTRSGSTP
jgi:tetratricopeptide (TPR) repeat protein